MKIILQQDKSTLRVYHDPREVIIHPKTKKVEIFNHDGTLLESYDLVEKNLGWLNNPANDTSEILLTLDVRPLTVLNS